jgi:hypothetical protein
VVTVTPNGVLDGDRLVMMSLGTTGAVETVFSVRGPLHMLEAIAAAEHPLASLPRPRSWRRLDDTLVYEYVVREHHRKGGRCRWYTVDGQRVQGTLERRYAEALTRHGIEWRAHHAPTYAWTDANGRMHWYAPDFYLPAEDTFIEVKGFMHEAAREKMARVIAQNPGLRLRWIYEEDVVALEREGDT